MGAMQHPTLGSTLGMGASSSGRGLMNTAIGQSWSSSSGSGSASSCGAPVRGFAVSVEVTSGNVPAALAQLRRKCADADLFTELRKRDHHLNPSERRFGRQRASYNRSMGRIIMQRVAWLTKRRHIKQP